MTINLLALNHTLFIRATGLKWTASIRHSFKHETLDCTLSCETCDLDRRSLNELWWDDEPHGESIKKFWVGIHRDWESFDPAKEETRLIKQGPDPLMDVAPDSKRTMGTITN